MPYLRVTCPHLDPARRRAVAETLTATVVGLFTPPRGPSATEIRARTTVHFTGYGPEELFVGGHAATDASADVTVEVSDWSMSVRQQGRVATRLTPVLVQLFDAEPDAVNLRFHSYPPTAFAVGGVLLSRRGPPRRPLGQTSAGIAPRWRRRSGLEAPFAAALVASGEVRIDASGLPRGPDPSYRAGNRKRRPSQLRRVEVSYDVGWACANGVISVEGLGGGRRGWRVHVR